MAKRGQPRQWIVSFDWQDGPHGLDSFASQDTANGKVRQFEESAIRNESTVTVKHGRRGEEMTTVVFDGAALAEALYA